MAFVNVLAGLFEQVLAAKQRFTILDRLPSISSRYGQKSSKNEGKPVLWLLQVTKSAYSHLK